jgi:hypothetical protein
MANIQDLDDYLDQNPVINRENLDLDDEEINQKPKKQKFYKLSSQLKNTGLQKTTEDDEDPMKNFVLDTASISLSKNAKIKLENYLKKSPQYKTLTIQIQLLQEELINYKNVKRKDLVDKTKELLSELTESRSKFVKLYKTKDWKQEKTDRILKIGNSEYLKELKLKRKALEDKFQMLNPNSLVNKLKDLRQILNISEKFNDLDLENFDDDDVILDIDEILETESNFSYQQEYDNLCGHISDIIHIIPREIQEMSLTEIRNKLNEEVDKADIEAIRSELNNVKYEASAEISKLKGNEDITTVMYQIFDFEVVDEKQPKEMLAAANIEYVKAIAYNSCRKLNMLRNLDDAIGYGLMGLSIAINSWYKIQIIKDSPVSFTGFANQYVVNSIKKGLYSFAATGTLTDNVIANMIHQRKRKFENFLKVNPELKDLPTEMIESLIDGLEDKVKPNIPRVSSESDIIGIISSNGDQEGDSDMWVNFHKSDINDETFVEVKNEYEHLLKSLKALFNMFETKTDVNTGEKKPTQFKIFDKYDYKLFRLIHGLEFKRESLNNAKTIADNTYTQTEIGIILADYYKANGVYKQPFSQPAIADRVLRMNKKLKAVIDENPIIKAGLQRLLYYCEAHSEVIHTLSNIREETEINKDRKELSEIYSNNVREMNKILSDGKTLGDIYNNSSENPLDDEISQAFRNY